MWIIDRYLARVFFRVLIVTLFSFIGLYIVIDGFGNMDSFTRYGARTGNTLTVVARYYGIRSLVLFERASGVVSVMAAMFAAALLQRSSEFTALEAAGISKGRLVRPLLLAAFVVMCLATVDREFLIPRFRGELGRTAQDLLGDEERQLFPRYDNLTEILIGGRVTISAERRIRDVNFRPPAACARFGRQIIASNGYWQEATSEHPSGYLLQGVKHPDDLAQKKSEQLADETVIFAPGDTAWLKPDECFVASQVSFEQLEAGPSWRDYAATFDLVRGLRNPSLDYGADIRTVIHGRLLRPFLDFLLVILGLPVVLTRQPRNVFATAGWCLAVVGIFLIVSFGFQTLGFQMVLSPTLAAWGPLFVFVPLAAFFSQPLLE